MDISDTSDVLTIQNWYRGYVISREAVQDIGQQAAYRYASGEPDSSRGSFQSAFSRLDHSAVDLSHGVGCGHCGPLAVAAPHVYPARSRGGGKLEATTRGAEQSSDGGEMR